MNYREIAKNLRIRAEIRMSAKDRRSVKEGASDRLSQQLLQAAECIEHLAKDTYRYNDFIEFRYNNNWRKLPMSKIKF